MPTPDIATARELADLEARLDEIDRRGLERDAKLRALNDKLDELLGILNRAQGAGWVIGLAWAGLVVLGGWLISAWRGH